ncbi:MAG: hypothetical protein K0R98_162 [Rickettsiaceae bacterium]|jgi:hypothetical protein|nr:hypothetical protein [Rickettsiaceae bacterium]
MSGRIDLLKQRFALWALGQALPESDSLKRNIRVALMGLVIAVAGGVLLALAVATAISTLYFYISAQGYSTTVIYSVIAIAFIMPSIIAIWMANKLIQNSANIKDSVSLFGKKEKDEVSDLINQITHSFLEGLLSKIETNQSEDALKNK